MHRVVLKEELLAQVWPDVVVSPSVLPSSIRRIRSAVGQSARETQPIQTLHRRGYRLNLSVERVARSVQSAQVERVRAAQPPVWLIG